MVLSLLVQSVIIGTVSVHAQNQEQDIYIPIVESFVPIKQGSTFNMPNGTVRDGGENSFAVASCQDLFRGIQKNAKVKQDEVFRTAKPTVYEQFPQCFVTGKTGVGIIENYLGTIYQWMAGIVGAVAVLMIVVGGIQIITGGGDQNNVSEGRSRIIQALVGLVVLFLSGLILYTINPTFFS